MQYSIRVLSRAREDVDSILHWISTTMTAPAGAKSWLRAFDLSCQILVEDPLRFPTAAEDPLVSCRIQQLLFKTNKGRTYRIIFTVDGSEVLILRVRGPGQPPLTNDEISL